MFSSYRMCSLTIDSPDTGGPHRLRPYGPDGPRPPGMFCFFLFYMYTHPPIHPRTHPPTHTHIHTHTHTHTHKHTSFVIWPVGTACDVFGMRAGVLNITTEHVLLPQNVFSCAGGDGVWGAEHHDRMCSLTTECVLLRRRRWRLGC